MSDSILTGTKKILGVAEDYTAFDYDIVTQINSSLAIVSQLGIGPSQGMAIFDNTTTWEELTLGDPFLNLVKTYVYLRVRLLFDPPATSFVIKAQEEQLREIEWRLNVHRESAHWTEPGTEDSVLIVDGGRP